MPADSPEETFSPLCWLVGIVRSRLGKTRPTFLLGSVVQNIVHRGAKIVPLEIDRGAENRPLTVRSGTLSLSSGFSPSAQVKAAAAQVGDCNWIWRKSILCPTIQVGNTFSPNFHMKVSLFYFLLRVFFFYIGITKVRGSWYQRRKNYVFNYDKENEKERFNRR